MTKCSPHLASKIIVRGKLTFDEKGRAPPYGCVDRGGDGPKICGTAFERRWDNLSEEGTIWKELRTFT
jgi:hypothetical protein